MGLRQRDLGQPRCSPASGMQKRSRVDRVARAVLEAPAKMRWNESRSSPSAVRRSACPAPQLPGSHRARASSRPEQPKHAVSTSAVLSMCGGGRRGAQQQRRRGRGSFTEMGACTVAALQCPGDGRLQGETLCCLHQMEFSPSQEHLRWEHHVWD